MATSNYGKIIRLAFPIILANASVPLLGIADTAAIGRTGAAADLGAIALATLVFSFVYWGFGFLRMGTTGFVAQAHGSENETEIKALFFRASMIALAIGVALISLQYPIKHIALSLMDASAEVKSGVAAYFDIRIWGAPATLITFVLIGTFIGMGWTKKLLWIQLFLNGLNIALNLLFVLVFNFKISGIALGTVIAEWVTLLLAAKIVMDNLAISNLSIVFREIKNEIFDRIKIIALFKVNADIMIRTLALLAGFAWFANQGAIFGDEVLAANHILLQFVSFSAFFLDGYAYVAEMLSGKAYGAKDKQAFVRNMKDSTLISGLSALVLAVLMAVAGGLFIQWLTQDVAVQDIAKNYLLYASIYILVSFAAFQLDGIFVGTTQSKAMRNATLLALVVFIALGTYLTDLYANKGLWLAFIAYVVFRAIGLLLYLPKVLSAMNKKIAPK